MALLDSEHRYVLEEGLKLNVSGVPVREEDRANWPSTCCQNFCLGKYNQSPKMVSHDVDSGKGVLLSMGLVCQLGMCMCVEI